MLLFFLLTACVFLSKLHGRGFVELIGLFVLPGLDQIHAVQDELFIQLHPYGLRLRQGIDCLHYRGSNLIVLGNVPLPALAVLQIPVPVAPQGLQLIAVIAQVFGLDAGRGQEAAVVLYTLRAIL